ncbi:hypothetical protein [Variovorax soli]|uniref:Type IV secretory pathway VirB10-like protein n=1 Tax=Variovorax soli TaxID=376815 RepID=A0ABU1NJ35_9BURK|nr:hypothetical protein [Variovorax soli]MDR6538467.1 type IV secretory pathway VirB10-like protein [Variovorax soli]
MRRARLGKGLQAGSLVTAVLTALALLKPEAVDPWPSAVEGMIRSKPQSEANTRPAEPWLRAMGALPAALEPAPPPPAPPPPPPAPPPDILPPPQPVAPDPPFTYLGRIDQDGRTQVFLGLGADPYVVKVGDPVDAQWKVEKADAAQLELRYLPLNETRIVPLQ